MTVNDAITKLKVMLGADTAEVTVVENKFAEAELVDGTQVEKVHLKIHSRLLASMKQLMVLS